MAARRENPHGQAMGRLVVCAIAGALLGTALFAADSGSDCMKCAECLDDLYRCQEQRDNLWWGFVFGLGVAGAGWLSFRFNRGKWWLVGTLFGFALAGTATIRMWTTVCTPCNSVCIGCRVPMPHPGGGYGANGVLGREYLVLAGNRIVRTRASAYAERDPTDVIAMVLGEPVTVADAKEVPIDSLIVRALTTRFAKDNGIEATEEDLTAFTD